MQISNKDEIMGKLMRVAFCIMLSVFLWLGFGASQIKANEVVHQLASDTTQKVNSDNSSVAVFAGGCFWCMQPVFDELSGVVATQVGYIGGDGSTANYEDVSSGQTKHFEAINIQYNADKISYKDLLDKFFRNIDPTDPFGQFADKGSQYKTAVFYSNEDEKAQAEQYISELKVKNILPQNSEIHTLILPIKDFYAAEEYHQDYYKKNPMRYNAYKYGSGRVKRLENLWSN